MNAIRKFIIVDDDDFNNVLGSLAIKEAMGENDTVTFTVPEEGLDFIRNEYINSLEPAILFLDINMPTLTGWEFLEQFETCCPEIKSRLHIYIVSSSVDQRDKEKAEAHKHVKGFILKPLEEETIRSVAGS